MMIDILLEIYWKNIGVDSHMHLRVEEFICSRYKNSDNGEQRCIKV